MTTPRTLFARRPDLLGTGLAALGLGTVIFFCDDSLWWRCPIHQFAGILCPGCGMQHAIVSLFQGDWAGAAAANPTIYVGPLVIAGAVVAQRAGNRLAAIVTVSITLAYVVALTVLRNL